MVSGKLRNTKYCNANKSSYYSIGLAEIYTRVKHFKFAPPAPAYKLPVSRNAGHNSLHCRILDHSPVGQQMPQLSEINGIQVTGHKDKGEYAGEYHQQGLKGINVEQTFNSAYHSVESRNYSEYDDAPYHKLELDIAENYYAYGYRRYEQTTAGGEELTEQEHHRGRPLGSLSETFADEAVDGDCPCVIEPWKDERCHKQSSAYRSDEVHYIGQIGIETQFGRADKSSRADGRPGRSNCHEPAWHRASGNEIIFNISVFLRKEITYQYECA